MICIGQKNFNRMLIVILLFCLDFMLYILCPNLTINQVMSFTGIVAIVTLFIVSVLLYRTANKINFFLMFILTGFVFEFGQSIAVSLGGYSCLSPKWFLNINSGYFSSSEIWKSFFYSHMFMMSLIASYIVFYNEKKTSYTKKSKEICNNNQIYVGYFLLLISVVPTFYLLMKDITTVQVLGYGVSIQEGAHGIEKIYSLISELFPVSIIWLLIFDHRKWSQRFILTTVFIYMVLQLAGGSRIQIFRFAIVLILVYTLYYKKINKKNMVYLFIIGLVGVFVLSLVSSVRTSLYYSSNTRELINSAADTLWKNNFIIATFKELGNTQVVNSLVLKECPQKISYAYGTSYLKMLFSAVPNFWGGVHPSSIDVDVVFSPLYTKLCGLGASFISEAYWNFGNFSILFSWLLGYFLARYDLKLKFLCEKNNNRTRLFFEFYMSFLLVFWVRSSCNGFGRSMIYGVIPIVLCKLIENGHRVNLNRI